MFFLSMFIYSSVKRFRVRDLRAIETNSTPQHQAHISATKMSDEEYQQPQLAPSKPRVAFISGHIDLDRPTFTTNYASRLDAAIAAGDTFILSSSRGADTFALQHLLDAGVAKDRITVYLNTHLPPKPLPKGTKDRAAKSKANNANRRDPTPGAIQHYEDLGVGVKLVSGDHEKRDTVMTRESDYDVLWVRSEEETRAVYGRKWRPGRVSGTEKNRLRREIVAVGREALGRKAIWEGGDGGESEEDEGNRGGEEREERRVQCM